MPAVILCTQDDVEYAKGLKASLLALSRNSEEQIILIDPYTRKGMEFCGRLSIKCPSQLPALLLPSESFRSWYPFLPDQLVRPTCDEFARSCKRHVSVARSADHLLDPPASFFERPQKGLRLFAATESTTICGDHTELVHRVASAARAVGAFNAVTADSGVRH